jgi:nucleoside-diphosphate-sugar epimerase
MRLLVTGATGFVGKGVLERALSDRCYMLRGSVRHHDFVALKNVEYMQSKDLTVDTEWMHVLEEVDVVIHTAARVHIMKDDAKDPLSDFRRVNVDGTLNFARQAAKTGIKRFIFLSSIKVNGESTILDKPFTELSIPDPKDPYGISKLETEEKLFKLSRETGMEIVCIRPPLVYGVGVKANFLSMMKWLSREVLLPFGLIHNKRSLVALDNLVDLILTCIEHPNAANQVFLVSDGEDLSTTELLSRVANALGKKSKIFPVNQQLLELALTIIGKKDLSQRLCGSLQVDISKAKKLLNWTPPVSVDEGLRKTAEEFLKAVEGQS